MKRSYISHIVGAGVLAASLAGYTEPNKVNSSSSVTSEKAVPYRDPNQMKLSDTDGTSNRY